MSPRCSAPTPPPTQAPPSIVLCRFSSLDKQLLAPSRPCANKSITLKSCKRASTIPSNMSTWALCPASSSAPPNFKEGDAMSNHCCEGVRPPKFSRRFFMKQGGIAMVGLSTVPAFLQRAVAATPAAGKKQLVVLFQRGAADGLNIVVP